MGYIGQPLKRFEDAPLVTGQGSFIGDMSLPNMLHAAVFRSDYAHALIRSIDVSAARRLPWVVSVLTAADIEGILQDLPSRPMAGERMVEEMNPPSHPLLAGGKGLLCRASGGLGGGRGPVHSRGSAGIDHGGLRSPATGDGSR